MKKALKNQSGFTLIELMIVVAIIGILAAVAIPQYQNFTKKSKSSEAKVILDGILTAQAAYFAEKDGFVIGTAQMVASLGNPASSAHYYNYNSTATGGTSVTITATPNTAGGTAGLENDWVMRYWGPTGVKSVTYPPKGW